MALHWHQDWESCDSVWHAELPSLPGSGDGVLPVERRESEITQKIYHWKPFGINATTGSGKTTLVPEYAVKVLKRCHFFKDIAFCFYKIPYLLLGKSERV